MLERGRKYGNNFKLQTQATDCAHGVGNLVRLSEANSYSGWNRCVKQTATMLFPTILAKSSTRGG